MTVVITVIIVITERDTLLLICMLLLLLGLKDVGSCFQLTIVRFVHERCMPRYTRWGGGGSIMDLHRVITNCCFSTTRRQLLLPFLVGLFLMHRNMTLHILFQFFFKLYIADIYRSLINSYVLEAGILSFYNLCGLDKSPRFSYFIQDDSKT